jgi:adenosylcobinamide-phosphate guanylyltransferase
MCGGRGRRLDAAPEKPLYPVGGRPMVDRVCDALANGPVDRVHAVTAPHAPDTRDHLLSREDDRLRVVEAPGEGYVADLSVALDRPKVDPPVLTVAADLPLLSPDAVDRILGTYREREAAGSLRVAVPVALKRLFGVSVDGTLATTATTGTNGSDGTLRVVPSGMNVVGGDGDGADGTDVPHRTVTYDARLAVNVNYVTDARIAEVLA